ncbi:hypothetical protein EC973_008516 [Apophysomyces ossiformis]|uniref:HTH APSES-type domain-containing protein n=1 Tax=Apophysomyces ossiformis TaxID=679940 RepID=A0A8H7BL20_9FUNG|nr:hypothetical protein EC973_008516 [Apophysomyces ossiformis]
MEGIYQSSLYSSAPYVMQPPTDHPSYHYRPSAFSDARSAYQPTLSHSQGDDYMNASSTTTTSATATAATTMTTTATATTTTTTTTAAAAAAVAAAAWTTSSPGLPWNSSGPSLPPSVSSSFMTGARPGYGGPTAFGPTSSSIPGLSNAIQRPKLTTTVWEDEGTLCYQVDAKSICVARRQDNDMINGTKLLNVVGMSRGKRDGILKNEKGRVVVKVGAMHLKGVWITFSRAKDLATKFKIVDLLYPLFVEDPSVFLCHHSPATGPSNGSTNNHHPNSHSTANPSMPIMMPTNTTPPRALGSFHYRPDHYSLDMQSWDRSYPTSLPSITSTQQEQFYRQPSLPSGSCSPVPGTIGQMMSSEENDMYLLNHPYEYRSMRSSFSGYLPGPPSSLYSEHDHTDPSVSYDSFPPTLRKLDIKNEEALAEEDRESARIDFPTSPPPESQPQPTSMKMACGDQFLVSTTNAWSPSLTSPSMSTSSDVDSSRSTTGGTKPQSLVMVPRRQKEETDKLPTKAGRKRSAVVAASSSESKMSRKRVKKSAATATASTLATVDDRS